MSPSKRTTLPPPDAVADYHAHKREVVAIYARFSRNPDDKSESTVTQVRIGKKRAEAVWPGCRTVVFADDNYSGGDADRPRLLALYEAITAGDVTQIMTKNQDRVERDVTIWETFMGIATAAGIYHLHTWSGTVGMRIGDRTHGRINSTIGTGYREQVSFNVCTHLADYAEEGRPPGGTCFGYVRGTTFLDVDGERTKVKTLIPDPDIAPVVRQVFADVLAGKPMSVIAGELNEQQVPLPRGTEWRPSNIRRILMSPTLTAMRIHIPEAKRKQLRAAGIHTFGIREGEEHGKVSEGIWEAIIDRAAFLEVQALLTSPSEIVKANGQTATRGVRRNTPTKYLLSGIARCGLCKTVLSGTARTGGRSSMYVCHSTSGGCNRLGANLEGVDKEAERQFLEKLDSKEYRRALAKGDRHASRRTELIKALEQVNVDRKLDARDERRPDGMSRETFLIRAKVLDEEELDLKAQLEALPAPLGAIDPDVILKGWNASTQGEKRAIFRLARVDVVIGPALVRGNRFDPTRVDVKLGEL